jgi:shikimate kinase
MTGSSAGVGATGARRTKRHLVLIGLPGAGKTTVGRLLAERLDTHWTDIDPILERATGLSISELFLEEGEPAFREREHRAVLQALGLPPHVISPGGGWAAVPGQLDAVKEQAVPVHLAVDPAVAAVRLSDDRSRPLLAGSDLSGRLAELARERAPWYQSAPVAIDVSAKSADQVADLLLSVARERAGW